MVYTKRQLHPNEQYVCIGTSCASDPIPDTDLDAALGHAPGFIKVTDMGYPVSSVGDGAIRISAAGARWTTAGGARQGRASCRRKAQERSPGG